MKNAKRLSLVLFVALFACSAGSPVDKLKKELGRYPEYSILLEDMREDGNFFPKYYHKYKVVYGMSQGRGDTLTYQTDITDWYEVKKREYKKFEPYLGMVVASKSKDGKIDDAKYPPGYQYVGDSRYGQWRTDNRGNSFWEFYGKYAFFSSMFGMFNRPVYRNDWNTYRDYRGRNRDYYAGRRYGTNGTYTKTAKPNFYQRRMQRERARQTRFSQRVKQRVRRSNMSGFRRRSSRGFGK